MALLFRVILILGLAAVSLLSCGDERHAPGSNPYQTPSSQDTLAMDEVRSALPQIEGYEAIRTNCIYCHSLQYIDMQPPFPETTWEHIIRKMVVTYGAPIPDTTARKIVKYLATVKGIDGR